MQAAQRASRNDRARAGSSIPRFSRSWATSGDRPAPRLKCERSARGRGASNRQRERSSSASSHVRPRLAMPSFRSKPSSPPSPRAT